MSAVAELGVALRALVFVEWRTWLWRIGRLRRSIPALLVMVAGVAAFAAIQAGGIDEPDVGIIATPFLVGLSIMITLMSITAVRISPIRMRGADVAWVVPRPQGPRALVVWHVVNAPVRTIVIAGIGSLIGAAIARRSPAWTPLVGIAAVTVVMQVVPTLVHLVGVHGGRVVRGVLQVVVPVWWLTVVASVWDRETAAWIPETVRTIGEPGRLLLDTLVTAVLAPGTAVGLGWAVLVVAAMVVVSVWFATGYEEAAAMRAWEAEVVRSAMRDGSLTGEVMSDAIAKQVSSGVRSLDRSLGLGGEWALLWAALATLRRTWLRELRVSAVMVVIAIVLAVLAPTYAWLPAGVWLVMVVVSMPMETAMQRSKPGLYVMPGRAGRKLAALDAGSTVTYMGSVVLAAIPWLVVAELGWGGAIGTVLVAVVGTVAITAATGAVALAVTGTARQFGFGSIAMALVGLLMVVGWLAAVLAGLPGLSGATAVAVAVSLVSWWWGARLLERGRTE